MAESILICRHNKNGTGYCECLGEYCVEGPCTAEELIEYAPVRHGRWEPTMTSKTVSFYLALGWKCSCCGCEIEDKSEKLHYPKHLKYCWNCGAKMEKQKEKPDDSD